MGLLLLKLFKASGCLGSGDIQWHITGAAGEHKGVTKEMALHPFAGQTLRRDTACGQYGLLTMLAVADS